MLKFSGIALLFLSFIFFQCGVRNDENHSVNQKEIKEPLIEENIKITREESRLIDRYIERYKWDMQVTGTGLRYMIYEKGNGAKAENKMHATVNYEIRLLDGTLCYTSEENGPKKFLIGRDNVESGIHEGITLMQVGDRAKFILPSYLAHGISGDQKKIPSRASLVVDLQLLRLD